MSDQDTSSVILRQIMKKLEKIANQIGLRLHMPQAAENVDNKEDERVDVTPLTLITILKKVEDIEKQLEETVANMSVEEACNSFDAYIKTKKSPRGHLYVTKLFRELFAGRNIADINADDMEEFMEIHCGDMKPNTFRLRHAQLNGLFNHAILMQKKKGMPVFYNPMELVETPDSEINPPEFLQPEFIRSVISHTRTIRRQVQEYVPYTNRISLIEDFTPTDEELRLYDLVSEYLQRPEVAAISTRQRHLMILIYRKILASSSFAIVKTLQSLANNIENRINDLEPGSIDELISDVEGYEEEKDEEPLENDEQEQVKPEGKETFTLEQLQDEKKELLSMKKLAESIHKNAKGDALIIALEKAFSHAKKLGWNEKAIIFTESRRTQAYLLRLLADNGYADQVTIFNGTNESPIAKRAYALWEKERTKHEGEGLLSKDAVIREALIHEFKNHTKIMIATEAGAEGINLQFCNIVINYDLPWNPQRVEQRIGRCHRYGQKSDVVVLNFLNRANAADQRVFELLDKKFRLFNGVFGASDEILGQSVQA